MRGLRIDREQRRVRAQDVLITAAVPRLAIKHQHLVPPGQQLKPLVTLVPHTLRPGNLDTVDARDPPLLRNRHDRDLSGRPHRTVRSEERRVGKARVSPCSSRWSPPHKKKK